MKSISYAICIACVAIAVSPMASRMTEVILRLSPLLLLTPAAVLTKSDYLCNTAWQYGITAIQDLGPVVVKFGQWVATRRDIFPPNLCDHLSVLHAQGNPHSWEYTHQVLTEAFGDYESKGLEIVDKVPIGCGSAAQVYRGILTQSTTTSNQDNPDEDYPSSKPVAIKVLHPNFSEMVESDLQLLQILAGCLHWFGFFHEFNLPQATEHFSAILRLQADLTNEANNLKKFQTNFDNNNSTKRATELKARVSKARSQRQQRRTRFETQEQNKNKQQEQQQQQQQPQQSEVRFPQPFVGWSSPKALVEDYVQNATNIADFLQDSTPEGIALRDELAGKLVQAYLKMLLQDNFVHGDLHPGNVMVRTSLVHYERPVTNASAFASDNSLTSLRNQPHYVKHSLVFLDAGIASSLSPDDQSNLRGMFRAVMFNDGNQAGRLMINRAKYESYSQVPVCVDDFAKGVQGLVSEFHERKKQGLSMDECGFSCFLGRVIALSRVHGVELDPALLSNVLVSGSVLGGLGLSLNPDLDVSKYPDSFKDLYVEGMVNSITEMIRSLGTKSFV